MVFSLESLVLCRGVIEQLKVDLQGFWLTGCGKVINVQTGDETYRQMSTGKVLPTLMPSGVRAPSVRIL